METKVMIVDDDEYIRLSVRELMESEGIPVLTADGALSCMAELKKGFKGLVLMDIMMPEFDGWDAIRMIINSNQYKDIIILMLTAREEPGRKMEGLQAYVTEYITKPFVPKDLVLTVRDHLEYIQ